MKIPSFSKIKLNARIVIPATINAGNAAYLHHFVLSVSFMYNILASTIQGLNKKNLLVLI